MSEKVKKKGSSQHGGSESSLPKKQNKITVEVVKKLRATLDWFRNATRFGNAGENEDIHVSSAHTSLHSLSSTEGEPGVMPGERRPLLNNVDNVTVTLEGPLVDDEDPYQHFPKEHWKTVIVVVALVLTMYLNTISLVLIHQRRPDLIKAPLPDIVLDTLPTVDNALYAAEVIIIISFFTTVALIIFHRFRWIVFRRCCFLVTILYFIRAFTMYLTVFPDASYTYPCSPKLVNPTAWEIMSKALSVLIGFGLSINGRHIYCGDYMYSGHAVTLVITFLFVQEYAPRSNWKWLALHWFIWCLSVAGIILILLSRGHYTIDIVVAYYFTTTMFWIYHTMANVEDLRVPSENNFIGRVCWFQIFNWLEANVNGILPRQYSLPWSKHYIEP